MLSKTADENLELRLVAECYADEVFAVVSENLEHLHEWLPWATEESSVDSTREFIYSKRREFAENDMPGFFIFENGKVVGGIGFNNPDFLNKTVEIGYWLSKKHTGKGIITKCCRVLIDFAFYEKEFNRIGIHCAVENKKSRAIPEKLGFTNEGTLRQISWLHDRFIDLVIYSMLKEEWRK